MLSDDSETSAASTFLDSEDNVKYQKASTFLPFSPESETVAMSRSVVLSRCFSV